MRTITDCEEKTLARAPRAPSYNSLAYSATLRESSLLRSRRNIFLAKTPRTPSYTNFASLREALSCFAAVMFIFSAAHAATPVGEVMVATGVVTAQNPAGETRTLAKGSSLFEKDRVKTADKSFAMLKLADDTKIAVRPNSEFVLDKFNQGAGQEAEELRLLKGGLRALTGAIGKQKPEAVKVNTPYASIGIRGTDFAARLCGENDCVLDEKELERHKPIQTACPQKLDGTPSGGYVVVFDGGVYAQQGAARVDLRPIEGAYMREGVLQCVAASPNFMVHDPYLRFITLGDDVLELFNIFSDQPGDQNRCTVPAG